MSKENFNKLNENKKSKFSNKTFKTPEKFEKNYYKYFPQKHVI